ncbi:fumarylacetoacetase [Dactylosporangium matsuzakiense]|uniref:fumarylacetoacetase n=1 Tax=Dactylosporangium matsuzakiense TaxID=53360 RepID=A0A9W6KCK8_9ACTN|nr:fumarylacetoacetase [Dactylosporangium matsuzakiense]UWZ45229.1 fumarylacetoacetase [Dactylosporangium matsuzakiense]GLK98802.1 fumarylacetoacetase [Dactylosporangium matsuzakiense]
MSAAVWLGLADDDPFGVENLPYCAFGQDRFRWTGVRIGDRILNLAAAEGRGLIEAGGAFLGQPTLSRFMAAGRPVWTRVRERLAELLSAARYRESVEPLLVPVADVRLALPFEVADYVDFYSSLEHATNLGKLFRPDGEPLLPNWRHLPVGYHGRAGTVVVSGTEVPRPCGQRRAGDFGPSARLDIEAEVGFVVGVPSQGAVAVDDFREHVFGAVLVNDWSARDLQAWEYQPLGPFLGKSFRTSISPWVVPLDALDAARVPGPPQEPGVLPYLAAGEHYGYDIGLEVSWNGTLVSRPPFGGMYWTPAQQLAHMTVNGAWTRTGDLYASGTVSGPQIEQTGSFIERTWNGARPVLLDDGTTRSFLLDGDTVAISATAPGPGGSRIGFGEVIGTIGCESAGDRRSP